MNIKEGINFEVNNIHYTIVDDDIYRHPCSIDGRNYNLKKIIPNYRLKYKINGTYYTLEEITNKFVKSNAHI